MRLVDEFDANKAFEILGILLAVALFVLSTVIVGHLYQLHQQHGGPPEEPESSLVEAGH